MRITLVALSCLLLAGCENALDKLKDHELLKEGNECFEKRNYESAIKFFEHFENKFPSHAQVMESNYKRAIAYYSTGQYPSAIAAFEHFIDQYPANEKVVDACRHLFFCYYNQVSRYDRNYEMIEKAIEQAEVFKAYYIEDNEFKEALSKLEEFKVYYYLNDMHLGLQKNPQAWIKSLWNISELMKNASAHKLSAEGYYRLIEFLTQQNSNNARKDALVVLEEMQKHHEESTWYEKAKTAIALAKPVDTKNLEQKQSIIIEDTADNDDIYEDSCETDEEVALI